MNWSLREGLSRFAAIGWAVLFWLGVVGVSAAQAVEVDPVKIADNVYALVGEMAQRSPQNLGNNATFGLVVTKEGAVLIDPGGSYKGAAQLDALIKTLTDLPVKVVINTGGQDHRWLGNGYWRERGARIIASKDAVADQQEMASMQLSILGQLVGKAGLDGTEPVHAEQERFDKKTEIVLGGVRLVLHHLNGAHTPGDSFVHLPDANIIFTGDIVYLDRLLGVLSRSNTSNWLESFNALAALKPKLVVPGHGRPAPLAKAEAETLAYLQNLRAKVRAHLENGGEMKTVVDVEQGAFQHLKQFDSLAKRNAMAVFTEMEFE
jgi:glyoxylase-like metal-dependent hydrolase (beta-lactamase superfamily II)